MRPESNSALWYRYLEWETMRKRFYIGSSSERPAFLMSDSQEDSEDVSWTRT